MPKDPYRTNRVPRWVIYVGLGILAIVSIGVFVIAITSPAGAGNRYGS